MAWPGRSFRLGGARGDRLRAQNGVGDSRDPDHFRDVMHADDVRPAEDARGDRRRGAPDAVGILPGSRHLRKETLSRRAYQQRVAEARKFGKFLEQFVILRRALAESDAGIEHDLCPWHPGTARDADGATESGRNVAHDITRERSLLHRAWIAAHVHQDYRHLLPCSHLGKARIGSQGRNIIYDLRALFRGCFPNLRLARVDRNGNLQPSAKFLEHWEDAAYLVGGGNAICARPRRFTPHVDHVRAGPFHFKGAGYGGGAVEIQTAVGETVGRDVEHAHHQRAFAEHERARWQPQLEFLALKHGGLLNHGLRETIRRSRRGCDHY